MPVKSGSITRRPLPPGRQEPRASVADPGDAIQEGRWLEAVGVSAGEERCYKALLDHPGATLPELANRTRLSRRQAHLTLETLQLKGLVTYTPERHHHYFPTPPEVAVEALILRQQAAQQRARMAAARLQQKAQRAHGPRAGEERVIEVITGREVRKKFFVEMQRSAQQEAACFDCPPYVLSPITARVNDTEFEALAHGVRYRTVYDSSSLELPGAIERIRAFVDAGEHARVFRTVPLKLFAADHRFAIVPLDLKHPDGASLLVRSSALLDALYALFESVWERAAPLVFTRGGARVAPETAVSPPADTDALVALLAAGQNDRMIARQLEISARTLARRLDDLMKSLDAHTRFQAGWLAAHRLR